MDFDQTFTEVTQRFERKQKLIQRAERRYEREAFAGWSSAVMRRADEVGITTPTPADLALLKRLAEMFNGPFSAAKAVRRGWCGIRSAKDATTTLERFVGAGWLHTALPNREGQACYAFTREYALGTLPHDDRPFDSVDAWNYITPVEMLEAAEFLVTDDGDEDDDEPAVAECGFCPVPDSTAEADTWALARKIAFEQGTVLHRIADAIDGLSPIHKAYAMAIAQDRIIGTDPIRTHVRGIAEYLGVDYNALRAGIAAAVAAIQQMNEKEKCEGRGQSRNSNADH